MNVRAFCREPGYRSALILTWSFDAVFFERVVLTDLHAGDTGTIAVLADSREVTAAMSRWPGMTQHLGRRYVLDTATVSGHFHPKVMLRVGPQGATIWVGTGNVTPSGWGTNRELASSWRAGPGHADTGNWLPAFLNQIASWTGSPFVRQVITRMLEEPWIQGMSAADPDAAGLVWTSAEATLAERLGRRWKGRRFAEVLVTTGSTDETGAFLEWAHRTFGVQTATIAVHAESACFEPTALEALPIRVEFIEPLGPKPLHAKSYWFAGPDGPAAVMGSANCSASAWVRPMEAGGNVEVVAAIDSPQRTAWHDVLSVFDGPRVSVREHLRRRPSLPMLSAIETRYRLATLELESETGRLMVRVQPAPSKNARVTLLIEGEEIPLSRHDQGSGTQWEGPRPESHQGARALFGSVRVVDAAGTWIAGPRWIDVPHELRDSARDRRVSSALGRLAVAIDAREQRRVVEDLQLAMDAIFNDPAAFPDTPLRHSAERSADDDNENARRLDPRRLAVDIQKAASLGDRLGTGVIDLPASLSSVLRMLFGADDEAEVTDGASEEIEGDENAPKGQSAQTDPRSPQPPEKLRQRLARQIDRALDRYRERRFADTCTATQLVEAIAFPMAVATLGTRSGWVDQAAARRWVVAAVTALLHQRMEGGSHEGLLDHVNARYSAEGRGDVFAEVIGNGLLWAAAATVLAGFSWTGTEGRIRRALILREVFRREELSARADASRLSLLAARFRQGDAVATITQELPRVDTALEALEAWLATNFQQLLDDQARSANPHLGGDPLWRPGVGWVFVAERSPVSRDAKVVVQPWRPGRFSSTAPLVRVDLYVNVRIALEARALAMPPIP